MVWLCSKFWWLSITFLHELIPSVYGLNILAIVTSPLRSHTIFAASFLTEMGRSGHSVTILSAFEESSKINEVIIQDYSELEGCKFRQNSGIDYRNDIGNVISRYEDGLIRTESILTHPSFRKLLSPYLSVDVILVDFDYNEALLGLAAYFNRPVVVLSTSRSGNILVNQLLGMPNPWLNVNFFGEGIFTNILDKIENFITKLYERSYVHLVYNRKQSELFDRVFHNITNLKLEDVVDKYVQKIFVTSLSEEPPIYPTNAVDITGIHIPEKDFSRYSFSDSLDNFMHTTITKGFIYVSLGDNISSSIAQNIFYTIMRVLSQREEKIIWSWNGNVTQFKHLSNFHFDKWLPQNDILRQRNIKLFITSGGHLSLTEAIYNEVPVIGIPFSNEQISQVDDIVQQGLGIKVDPYAATDETLMSAINEVLGHEKYQRNVYLKFRQYRDRPMKPFQVFKYWIEFIYRHRFDRKLPRKRLTSWDFYFMDIYLISFIYLVIILVLTLVLGIVFYKYFTNVLANRKHKLY